MPFEGAVSMVFGRAYYNANEVRQYVYKLETEISQLKARIIDQAEVILNFEQEASERSR